MSHKSFLIGQPQTMLSAINLVPLVGVLAVLTVVFMVGLIPGATRLFTANYTGSCFICMRGKCRYAEFVTLRVGENGLVTLDGNELSITEIGDAIRLDALHQDFERFYVEISASADADYAEVLAAVGQLKKLGLADRQIRLNDYDP